MKKTHQVDTEETIVAMDEKTFNRIRELVYDRSGITLGENKQALVRARIAKRMRHLNISDYNAYLHYTIEDNSGEEVQHMLDAISTNVTSFYREPSHFDFTRDVVDDWIKRGMRHLRFWSAASSSGEEPYTIAIELREIIGRRNVDAKILATDISTRIIEAALEGVYSESKVAPVPPNLLKRYFTSLKDGNRTHYRVNDILRDMVVFRQFNLSVTPFPLKKPLDMIFCRNVMIYFDRQVRTRLVREFYRLLKPGGYLLVGHAESVTGMAEGFRCLRPSIYIKE
jgi:chemotaxis protein methyltransferase CheR